MSHELYWTLMTPCNACSSKQGYLFSLAAVPISYKCRGMKQHTRITSQLLEVRGVVSWVCPRFRVSSLKLMCWQDWIPHWAFSQKHCKNHKAKVACLILLPGENERFRKVIWQSAAHLLRVCSGWLGSLGSGQTTLWVWHFYLRRLISRWVLWPNEGQETYKAGFRPVKQGIEWV